MDDLMARTIVENLILGVDPMTGRALGSEDSCSNEVVQEALRMVLEHCSLKSYKTAAQARVQNKAPKKKNNFSAKDSNQQHDAWGEKECHRLVELCREGKCILEMAHELKCSTDVICEKLKNIEKGNR